jgi:hypothetical protein
MLLSLFTFYRGAALIMSSDLGRGPRTDLITQLYGDARVGNFGVFASPERRPSALSSQPLKAGGRTGSAEDVRLERLIGQW